MSTRPFNKNKPSGQTYNKIKGVVFADQHKMRTFAGALPSGNYNFGSGVFLCDEGTPPFVTYKIAKTELKR